MSKTYEINTIEDLIDVTTAETVELLKKDMSEFLNYVVTVKSLSPLGVTQIPKFIWNDDGVEGIKAIHFEVNEPDHKGDKE